MSKSTSTKTCICILGMHRSGTSAISGALHIVGADFGKDLIPSSYDNLKGFYENSKILEINERLLSVLGFDWDYPGFLPANWIQLASVRKHIAAAQKIIKQQFESTTFIAIKDPRNCHLFPFWKKCLEELGYEVKNVLIWRDPVSVVNSLKRRNNLKGNHSYLLLASYFSSAILNTKDSHRTIVNYQELIINPVSVLHEVLTTLGLKLSMSDQKQKELNEFVSGSLQHNRPNKANEYEAIIPHLTRLYKIFSKVSIAGKFTNSETTEFEIEYANHRQLTDIFYSGILSSKEYFCKIFLDTGKGFNESETISFPITTKLHSWDIGGLALCGDILRIRILPINAPAKIIMEYLGVDDDLEQAYSISSNAYFKEDKTLYFDNPHSEVIINFDNPYVADKLVLTIKYLETGSAVFPLIKDLDYGRMLQAKDSDIESKLEIISEREQHISSKELELTELTKIIRSYKKTIQDEKKEKDKVISNFNKALSAERIEIEKLKEGLTKAVEAERLDKEKVSQNLQKALEAEKADKQKVKDSLLKAVEAEKVDKQKVKDSLLKAVEAEKADKQKVKVSLQKALEAEKTDKENVRQSLLSAKAKVREELTLEIEALRYSMLEALQSEKEEKQAVINSMLKAIEAEKADKEHIRVSLLEKLHAELESERRIRDERISEATGLLYAELKDKEEKINVLRDTILHEINEKNKVVNELKDERQQVVSELISSVNHEIREKDRAVVRLQKAIQHEKIEQVRMFTELANSFSFKLGWFLTSPLRISFNFLNGLRTGKLGMAFKMAGLAMRNPSTTLKNLNGEKIKTLHSALKRESPDMISSNFDKLLNKGKIEQAQQTALIAQKDIFKDKESNEINSNIGVSNNEFVEDEMMIFQPASTNGKGDGFEKLESVIEIEEGASSANLSVNQSVAQTTETYIPKKILFISPNIPDFDTSSGGKRATRMLGLLAEENEVYAYARGARQQKYIDKLASLGVRFIEEYDYEVVKSQLPHLDVIIYAWYYTYHESIKFKELYPNAKLIMDSVDIHWVREARSIGLMKGLTKKKANANKKSEIAAYKNGDVVWAVTEPDRQAVLQEIPDADVRVVSNIHEAALEEYYTTTQNNILFFGGYNHYPNISAVKIIAEEILPKIRAEVPDAVLLIAGANAPQEVVDLGELDGVVYLGFIEEVDVAKLYESSIVTVAPLLAGAGIKGKICEAIAFMTPVITNQIGNEGIALIDGEEGFITEDFDAMATRVIECMQGKYDLATIAKKAQDKLHDIVGPEIVKKNMIESLHREVSICIVTWNRLELLKPCIDSILKNTTYPYYKILVHSNGCEDGTKDYLLEVSKTDSRIIPILSDKNDVFVIPNNQMAAYYPHNDAVLINNDVTVEKGWLQALVDAAYSSRQIGISGSKILYPDGTLQEFGSELYADGSGRNIGKWDKDPYKEEYSKVTAVGYVSGCSLFIKRETLKKVGLFDMEFHPCYCEDSDLCYTAWKNDIYTVVTPHSIINHYEGGTSGTDEDSGFKSYQKVNFDKFLIKHKKNLRKIADKIKKVNENLHQLEA